MGDSCTRKWYCRKSTIEFGSIVSLFGVSILGLIATIAWWRYADYD